MTQLIESARNDFSSYLFFAAVITGTFLI